MEENISKAQRTFFYFGSIIFFFCGDISPLSSRSVLETCDANSPLWIRELDSHGEPLKEAGVIPGRAA